MLTEWPCVHCGKPTLSRDVSGNPCCWPGRCGCAAPHTEESPAIREQEASELDRECIEVTARMFIDAGVTERDPTSASVTWHEGEIAAAVLLGRLLERNHVESIDAIVEAAQDKVPFAPALDLPAFFRAIVTEYLGGAKAREVFGEIMLPVRSEGCRLTCCARCGGHFTETKRDGVRQMLADHGDCRRPKCWCSDLRPILDAPTCPDGGIVHPRPFSVPERSAT